MKRITDYIAPQRSHNVINFGFVPCVVTDCHWITMNFTKSDTMMRISCVWMRTEKLSIPTE